LHMQPILIYRPMKIDIMFLVHNFEFSKIWRGIFSFFIIFCIWILLVNNFLDPVKNPIKIWSKSVYNYFNLIRPTLSISTHTRSDMKNSRRHSGE
jgi:hypothetical protein